jgi:hypothetical protein
MPGMNVSAPMLYNAPMLYKERAYALQNQSQVVSGPAHSVVGCGGMLLLCSTCDGWSVYAIV